MNSSKIYKHLILNIYCCYFALNDGQDESQKCMYFHTIKKVKVWQHISNAAIICIKDYYVALRICKNGDK